jgi:hypothetical protein
MDETLGPDPNEGSTDPMVPEYWRLGEDFQDRIRDAGYDSATVEGIAVDVHDILQAADRIREEIVPAAMGAEASEFAAELKKLQNEIAHIRWHTQSADDFLRQALAALEPRNEQLL